MADSNRTSEDSGVSDQLTDETRADNSLICCDICKRKDLKNVVAICYCSDKICKKRYCAEHRESHDEILEEHNMIDISGYSQRPDGLSKQFCERHPTERLTIGCKICHQHLCMKCVSDLTACQGSEHSLASLRTVYENVKVQVDDLRYQVEEKRVSLLALSNESEKVMNEYDAHTEKMIKEIEDTRDAQIQAISEKYARLAAELMTVRNGPYEKVKEFKWTAIDSPLEELTDGLHSIISAIESGNEVDAVNGYHRTKNKLRLEIDETPPSLTVNELFIELADEGECRSIELSLRSTDDSLTIGIDLDLTDTVYENFVVPEAPARGQKPTSNDVSADQVDVPTSHYQVPKSNQQLASSASNKPKQTARHYSSLPNYTRPELKPPAEENQCSICRDQLRNPLRLQCSHSFCKSCITEIVHYPMPNLCPQCSEPFDGTQPKGGAMITSSNIKLTGRGLQRWISIKYRIPFGVQQDLHPNPGQPYKGMEKTVNIPQTSNGLWVVSQLKSAFEKNILFTISDEGETVYNIEHPKSKYPSSSELNQLKDRLQLHLGVTNSLLHE